MTSPVPPAHRGTFPHVAPGKAPASLPAGYDFSLADLQAAEKIVREVLQPTPQIMWPLLAERAGCEVFVKHENHLPTGAFKVRGGLVYLRELSRTGRPAGIIAATRGNHGLSLAFAGKREGLPVTILVPPGNSQDKNAGVRALGAELIEYGPDVDEAREAAKRMAEEQGLHFVPPFHPDLVRGVATYALELLSAVPDLDTIYVPVGIGSGACGLIRVRDLLGLRTRIVAVTSSHAPAFAQSFATGRVIVSDKADSVADGIASRVPDKAALNIIRAGADRVVEVDDEEVAAAMQAYWTATHNLAEGAGAASLAALLKEGAAMQGRRVAIILSGGNVDLPLGLRLLSA